MTNVQNAFTSRLKSEAYVWSPILLSPAVNTADFAYEFAAYQDGLHPKIASERSMPCYDADGVRCGCVTFTGLVRIQEGGAEGGTRRCDRKSKRRLEVHSLPGKLRATHSTA